MFIDYSYMLQLLLFNTILMKDVSKMDKKVSEYKYIKLHISYVAKYINISMQNLILIYNSLQCTLSTVNPQRQWDILCRVKFKLPYSLSTIQLLLASERSERDTYRGKNEKIGDVYLFVYMFGRMYVILYFDPRVFVLVICSTPSQIALNRILWFIDQYPYHPRN